MLTYLVLLFVYLTVSLCTWKTIGVVLKTTRGGKYNLPILPRFFFSLFWFPVLIFTIIDMAISTND